MKKQAPLTRITFKEMKLQHLRRKVMTTTNIMYVIASLMKNHKGLDNAISGDDLFKQVYLSERKPDYVDDFRWDYVRKAMHQLRQSTKLFIACTKLPSTGSFVYFVPTTDIEAEYYIERLDNNIRRMRAMQRKAMKSIVEGWYDLDWVQESKRLTTYKDLFATKKGSKQLQEKFKK